MLVGYIYEITTTTGMYYTGKLISCYQNNYGVLIYTFVNYEDCFEVSADEIYSYNCLGV